jgi:hypothetical protein
MIASRFKNIKKGSKTTVTPAGRLYPFIPAEGFRRSLPSSLIVEV